MLKLWNKNQEEEESITLLDTGDTLSHQLIVWNDDVNTFDWVIKCLVEICDHSPEQAEQCALFIHFRGKYAVSTGTLEKLNPMREALLDRGLSVTIQSE